MSKNINAVKLLGVTLRTELDGKKHRVDAKNVGKLVSGLMIAGFREDTMPDEGINALSGALEEIAQELAGKINLHVAADAPDDVRTTLGLIWLSQIAQATWIGKLTNDPVVALAVSETWHEAHSAMAYENFTPEAQARLNDLLGGNDGEALATVLNSVANMNRTGCVCGKPHDDDEDDGDDVRTTLGDEIIARTLAGVPDNVRANIERVARMSGLTPEEIVGRFVQDVMSEGAEPKITDVNAGSLPVGGNLDPVETLTNAAIKSIETARGAKLRPDQVAAIRAQLEAQREQIVHSSGDLDHLHDVTLRVPK